VDRSLDVGAPEAAVEGDHLAVEGVQRPEAEVAVLGQLGEADVALIGAVQQSPDRRGLKEDVGLVLGVELAAPQLLHVQRPDQPLVEHRRSLSGSPG
jgi:hypothetical protein